MQDVGLRKARAILAGLESVLQWQQRFRRLNASTRARSNRREVELVEVSPGVWAEPRSARRNGSKLRRLHNALSEFVDVLEGHE